MLTQEEKATNADTWSHIHRVRELLSLVIIELIHRQNDHDLSKLESPEVELFTRFTDKLANTTFNSEEYNSCKLAMKPALDHHYANNRHHPEFYKNGVDDMSLIDLIEMFVDWAAASERHNNGNLRKSIEINANRFSISPQLVQIFENTMEFIGK